MLLLNSGRVFSDFSSGPAAPWVRNSERVGIFCAVPKFAGGCAGTRGAATNSFEPASAVADGCWGVEDSLGSLIFETVVGDADGFVFVSAIFSSSDFLVETGVDDVGAELDLEITAELGAGPLEPKRIPQNPGAASVNSNST